MSHIGSESLGVRPFAPCPTPQPSAPPLDVEQMWASWVTLTQDTFHSLWSFQHPAPTLATLSWGLKPSEPSLEPAGLGCVCEWGTWVCLLPCL